METPLGDFILSFCMYSKNISTNNVASSSVQNSTYLFLSQSDSES